MTNGANDNRAGLDAQALAVDPHASATVSASAGTGKTHVLTSRVLNLLLAGADPESILCLTFTRAGAANMADRIGQRLASWVRLSNDELVKELEALRADIGPETRKRARSLFARVLDAPGGIGIVTIHAFAQSLLAAFPAEAGVSPGLKPLEGRAADELRYSTLADLVSDAEQRGDRALLRDIEGLSERLSEKGAVKYLGICAAQSDSIVRIDLQRVEERLRELTGVHECDLDAHLAAQCSDGTFDCELLRALADANLGWTGKTGAKNAEAIEGWLSLDPKDRPAALPALANVFLTGGALRKTRPRSEGYDEQAQTMADAITALIEFQRGCEAISHMISGLRAGKAYAAAYARAKSAGGVADFADLIAWTRALLEQKHMAEWVRYKLDQRIDHVLVDEAQDTNADQWAIIDALTAEFFSGSSEAERRWRTFLAVGDFKQAIFGFQGTDPREFEDVRRRYKAQRDLLAETAEAEVRAGGDAPAVQEFHDLSMSRSYRSAQGILDVVDQVIAVVGHAEMGLERGPDRHEAAPINRHLEATVELWQPFDLPQSDAGEADNDNFTAEYGDGEEGWVDLRERRYATALAQQVRALIDSKVVLGSTGEPVRPGDVMVLVRSRKALAALIVARLAAADVPVGGVDRLRLHEPLAVQDLLAAMRFAVQPLDDLNLGCLLVSPLLGWSQDQLLELAAGRGQQVKLWEALRARAKADEASSIAHELLLSLLNMADFTSPAQFLETILSGPIQGRSKLFSRLGHSARDAIDELLSTAIAFERDESGSIERFLAWFRRGEMEVARDPALLADEVRVMTVHGAKGLEAPVVIIADAQIDPDRQGQHDDPLTIDVDGAEVPLPRSGTAALPSAFKAILEERKVTDRREHMRLLYVGLTRAIDRLVVAGLKPKRGAMPVSSWYSKVEQAMVNLRAAPAADVLPWGGLLRFHAEGTAKVPKQPQEAAARPLAQSDIPAWALRQAPEEERPPRPLAPSAIAADDASALPPSEAMRAAARRGTLIHSLLERLPPVPEMERHETALGWLERSAGVTQAEQREEIAATVCAILSDAAFSRLFGPGSIGEAPLAATLPDGRVIAGTVDRLLVEAAEISVIDFKTGRVPADPSSIPRSHAAQMEAYAEALRVIFPGRAIRSALLYTAGPKLFEL